MLDFDVLLICRLIWPFFLIIISGQGLNEALIMGGIIEKRYEKIWVCLDSLIKSAHNGYRDQVMGILSIKKSSQVWALGTLVLWISRSMVILEPFLICRLI